MKKNIIFPMMLTMVLTLIITSCSTSTTEDIPEVKFSSLNIKYTFNTGGDFLKVYDVTAQYKDASGKAQSETVTTANYTKTLNVTLMPYNSDVKFTFKIKDNIDKTASYSISYSIKYDYMPLYSDGTLTALTNYSESLQLRGAKYEALEYTMGMMNKNYNKAYSFSLNNNKISQTETTTSF